MENSKTIKRISLLGEFLKNSKEFCSCLLIKFFEEFQICVILQPKFATRFHKNSVGICISDKNPDTVWFADHITAELFKSYYRGVSGFLKVGGQVVMRRPLFCQKVGGGNCPPPPAPSSLTPLNILISLEVLYFYTFKSYQKLKA